MLYWGAPIGMKLFAILVGSLGSPILGAGIREAIFAAAGSIRFAGILFPGNAVRFLPSAVPVFGSNMHPAIGVTLQFVPVGIKDEKSPFRIERGATLLDVPPAVRILVPSYAPKKKSLSFLMGPPKVPPYWLKMFFGFTGWTAAGLK